MTKLAHDVAPNADLLKERRSRGVNRMREEMKQMLGHGFLFFEESGGAETLTIASWAEGSNNAS